MAQNESLYVWVRLRGLRSFIRQTTRASLAAGSIGGGFAGSAGRMRTSTLLMYRSIQFLKRSLMGLGVVAGIAGFGLAKAALDFEVQMHRVAAVTRDSVGAQKASFKEMAQASIDAASVTKFGNAEAAEGMYILASAGFTARQSVDSLLGTLRLAQATSTTVKMSAQVMASAVNSFGYEADQATEVADIMTRAVSRSALEMIDIAYAFKYAAAPASTLGFHMKDLSAALMIMAQKGIKGRTAGTTLRMAFSRMVNPVGKAADGLREMGLAVDDLHDKKGEMLPLFKILDKMKKGMKDMTGAEKQRAVAMFAGQNAMSGFLALLESSPATYAKMRKAIGDTRITAEKVGREMQDTTQGHLENMGNKIQAIFIMLNLQYGEHLQGMFDSIGRGADSVVKHMPAILAFLQPFGTLLQQTFRFAMKIGKDVFPLVALGFIALRVLAIALTKVIKFGNKHWETLKVLLIGAGGIWFALKAFQALKTIIWFAKFYIAILKVTKAIFLARGAMAALSFFFMTNPITIWIVAIGLVAIALYLLWTRCEWFRKAVWGVIHWIIDHWRLLLMILLGPTGVAIVLIIKHFNSIKGAVLAVVNRVKQIWGSLVNFFKGLPGKMASAAGSMFGFVVEKARGMVNSVIGLLNSMFNMVVSHWPDAPGLPGPPFGSDPIPTLAGGGTATRSGWSIVGESGPEMRYMPQGARVDPLPAGGGLDLSGVGGPGQIVTKVFLDKRQIAEAVHSYANSRAARA